MKSSTSMLNRHTFFMFLRKAVEDYKKEITKPEVGSKPGGPIAEQILGLCCLPGNTETAVALIGLANVSDYFDLRQSEEEIREHFLQAYLPILIAASTEYHQGSDLLVLEVVKKYNLFAADTDLIRFCLPEDIRKWAAMEGIQLTED